MMAPHRTHRWVAGTAAALVAVGLLTACGGADQAAVVVSVAATHTVTPSPVGTGLMLAATDRAVVVDRKSTVVTVSAVEGQLVQAGQPLLTAFTIGQSTAVTAAANQLRADETQLPFVKARYGNTSTQALTLIQLIGQERDDLATLRNSPTVITAPIAGRVSGLDALPGGTLDRSDAVLHVIDDSTIRTVVPLASMYRTDLATGQAAFLTTPGLPGRTFPATILAVGAVAPAIDGSTGITSQSTVAVTVTVSNKLGALVAGNNAYVRVPITRTGIAVDSLAVLGQASPYVFVVDGGVVRQRAVAVGAADGHFTEIVSGLAAGDRVVISGGARLVDGDPVKVTRTELQ